MAFWCHGAGGVLRFLLHLRELHPDAVNPDLIDRGAETISSGLRWSGPTQCHGLSGTIECMLDLYEATGDASHLEDAVSLVQLLQGFAVSPTSRWHFVTEHDRCLPGFTAGVAGVAASLLRFARPEEHPHLLTLQGLVANNRNGCRIY
jgi:lantibiotic modifying enzyme